MQDDEKAFRAKVSILLYKSAISMHWLPLTLFSAFFLATADTLTKRYLSHYRASELVLIRFGIAGILLLPLIFLQPWPSPPLAFWWWMIGLIPLEIISMWLYMKAIRESPLSLTLPYLAFTPVFNTVTGYVVLNESVSVSGFIGILLVVSGAWILNVEHARHATGVNLLAPFKAITREPGSRLMLIVAIIYSVTSVMGKGALQYVPAQFLGPFYYVALGFVALVIFRPRETSTWRVLTRQPWAHLFIGLFMAGMVVTHFYAIKHVEVAYMIAVKRTSLLFGMLYGAWLFKETGLVKNLVAGLLMIAGVTFIVGL